MAAKTENALVRMTYSGPAKLDAKEMALRKSLEDAVNQAVDRFLNEARSGLDGIELYPCDENCDCEECSVDAA